MAGKVLRRAPVREDCKRGALSLLASIVEVATGEAVLLTAILWRGNGVDGQGRGPKPFGRFRGLGRGGMSWAFKTSREHSDRAFYFFTLVLVVHYIS